MVYHIFLLELCNVQIMEPGQLNTCHYVMRHVQLINHDNEHFQENFADAENYLCFIPL